MTGFFSRLAHRTGVRIGPASAGARSAPAPAEAPPAPLEVEDVRMVASDPGPTMSRTPEPPPRSPGREGAEPGVRRIVEPAPVPAAPPAAPRDALTPAELPGERVGERSGADPGRAAAPPHERFETRIARIVEADEPAATPSGERPAEPSRRAIDDAGQSADAGVPGAPRRDATRGAPSRETTGMIEEYLVRMVEGEVPRSRATADTTESGGTQRELIREVIEWIGSPSTRREAREEMKEEPDDAVSRVVEVERMTEAPIPRVYDRTREIRTAGPFDAESYADPYGDPVRGGPREQKPDIQDVTLSIGSIRVVIEEPQSQAPQQQQPAPQARAEAPAQRPASSDGSRLSRHYITIG